MTWAVCSPEDRAIGYDLSQWQPPPIQWTAARTLGIRWSVSKTWHGSARVATAEPQIAGARGAGVEVLGRYAWLVPSAELAAQLRAWCSIDRAVDELPLTIDFEERVTEAFRGAWLVRKIEWAIESYRDAVGVSPIVYTGAWYWSGFCGDLDSEIVASCPLWLAAYPRKVTGGTRYTEAVAEVCGGVMPAVPLPWRKRNIEPTIWQWDGDRGLYLPGGADVDVSVAVWPRLFALVADRRREGIPTQPDTAAEPIGWQDRAEGDAEPDPTT